MRKHLKNHEIEEEQGHNICISQQDFGAKSAKNEELVDITKKLSK